MKDLISSSGPKNFVHISIMHQTSFCGAQNFVPGNNFVVILYKEWIQTFYFPERWKINWHILKTAKAHLKYPQGLCFFIMVHPPKHQNSRSARHCIQKILHQILRFFQPWRSWTSGFYWYEHVKAETSIKTFLKEHYVIAWDSCYLFTKI